jgi:hypothetical protein
MTDLLGSSGGNHDGQITAHSFKKIVISTILWVYGIWTFFEGRHAINILKILDSAQILILRNRKYNKDMPANYFLKSE